MIVDVILGNNIDTLMWIKDLKLNSSEYIFVLDYEYFGEPNVIDGVVYLSCADAKKHIEKFDSVYFYKSLYAYPGMSGMMSSLYKPKGDIKD